MSELLIRHGEWVVVCDGAKALVLENIGDPKFPNLKTIEVFEQKDLPTHLLGADKPGRTHSSTGHGRSAVTQTDWHDQSEQTFLNSSRPASRRCHHRREDQVTDSRGPAACAWDAPPGLFSRAERRVASRGG